MYITTDAYFLSTNLIVHQFYGEKTCFCWNQNKLVIFPYTNSNYASAKVLSAPAPIKTIQCFAGRIFLICIPQGIYKLSRDRNFAVLSKSAIGMGTVFYEVLTPRSEYLYLDNKQTMINKVLFQLSSKEIDSRKLCVYPLNAKNVAQHFISALTNNDSTIENMCVIGDGLKLLTLINETIQIIYNSIHWIRDIIPIQKNSRIAGLVLLTSTDVIILMYAKDNVLVFEQICLGIQIRAICVGFSELSQDTLWIVCSCESKLYYGKKQLMTDNIQRIKVEDRNFVSLQFYDSKIFLGLTVNNQLVEFSTDIVERTLSMENDSFINLCSNMLESANFIMDKIYKGTRELHNLNEILTTEEDKLRRINLYAHKHRIRLCPKVVIHRMANRLFLSENFHRDILPRNSWVVLNIKSECRNLFCTKKIVDQDTIIDICIPENLMLNLSRIATDLIAFKDKRHPWCLIRDYMINPYSEQSKKKKRRLNYNFINSKIVMLQTFIREGNIDVKKLSEFKRSVRKEINDI